MALNEESAIECPSTYLISDEKSRWRCWPCTPCKKVIRVIAIGLIVAILAVGCVFIRIYVRHFIANLLLKNRSVESQGAWEVPNFLVESNSLLTTPDQTLFERTYSPLVQDSQKVVSCYYNLPNALNSSELMPRNIDASMCTHINLAFASIKDKEISLESIQMEAIKEVLSLRDINPKLKFLLSIGGVGENSGFSDMVVDHASRKIFIRSIKYVLRNLTLDGVDLDWEFPAVHSTGFAKANGNRERQHFSQLLREIRAEFIREKRDYMLTVATAAQKTIVDAAYDVDQINEYTDYVNIMTYDFHFYSKISPFTGLNSPLFATIEDISLFSTFNINYTVNMYIDKGLDPSKIVVGIPTYGHSFQLVNSDNPTIGSPCSGYGSLGATGFVSFPEICTFISNFTNQVTIKTDPNAGVPYLYRGHEWISYDDRESVGLKALFIRNQNLRGAMIYSLNSDDYSGLCSGSQQADIKELYKFPLTKGIIKRLFYYDL